MMVTVTSEDVKFSLMQFLMKSIMAHKRPYYESIKEVIVIDKRTVKFVVKDTYFQNFDVVATMVFCLSIFMKLVIKKFLQ